MTAEQHLQVLIGALAIQLAQKDAEIDKLRAELNDKQKQLKEKKK